MSCLEENAKYAENTFDYTNKKSSKHVEIYKILYNLYNSTYVLQTLIHTMYMCVRV